MSNVDKEKMRRYIIDEPTMSDKTLLLNVEDLINWSFGTAEINKINFKLLKTVLQILARQMRLLEQEVEIRYDDLEQERYDRYDKASAKDTHLESTESSSSFMSDISEESDAGEIAPADDTPEKRAERQRIKEQKAAEKVQARIERAAAKEKQRAERRIAKEKEGREGKSTEREEKRRAEKEPGKATDKERGPGEKEESAASKERERAGKAAAKEKETADRAQGKGAERDTKQEGKEERATSKEREREDRGAAKDREREDRATSKDRDREDRAASKEMDREQRAASKERDKDEKAASKEKEREDRRAGKDKEKRAGSKGRERSAQGLKGKEKSSQAISKDRDRHGDERERGRKGSEQGERVRSTDSRTDYRKTGSKTAAASESDRPGRKGGKAEKGFSARGSGSDVRRVGSIEVVTQSEFEILKAQVKKLKAINEPYPMPSMPDNAKLREDLAKGRASLTDTMQAMQLTSRMQAAEEALSSMAGMVQHLAGVLPSHMQEKLGRLDADLTDVVARMASGTAARAVESSKSLPRGKTVGIESPQGPERPQSAGAGGRPDSGGIGVAFDTGVGSGAGGGGAGGGGTGGGGTGGGGSTGGGGTGGGAGSTSRRSSTGRSSVVSGASALSGSLPVNKPDMEEIILRTKQELMKYINSTTAKTCHHAEMASTTVKSVADKLDVAMKLEKRINTLFSQTADYAEQLNGFDSGLSTQMASFQEQMAQMRSDLRNGLATLESANNNAETAALQDLNERYEALVMELDNTLHSHQGLGTLQKQISDELRSLVECVEMLREQKADRDEVLDGLRDKADIWRLAGLLHESDFAVARSDLEQRIDVCYDKFRKQDRVWLGAIKDLSEISETKAEMLNLLALRENATEALRTIQDTLDELYILLGEPKAAILTRYLSRDGVCGACQVKALMEPVDVAAGHPHRLPALPRPGLPGLPCIPGPRAPTVPDLRDHVCRRWVGGSHTLMMNNVTREKAALLPMQSMPSKRYTGYGVDGKPYLMEEELEPCLECNKVTSEAAGDGPLVTELLPEHNVDTEDKGTGDQDIGDTNNDNPPVNEQGDNEKTL